MVKTKIFTILLVFILFAIPLMNILDVDGQVYSEGWSSRYSYDIDDGVTHRSTFYISPQVFWDVETDRWEELKFEDHYSSEGYYLIENSHITAKIYDWYTVFLDPDNQRVCVDDERWIVEVYGSNDRYREVDLYNPILTVHSNVTHLVVRRTFDTYEGTLEVNYILWQSSRLKHDVKFISKMSGENQFHVIMKLTGIYHDKVKHSGGIETIIGENHISSPYFIVGEDNDNLVFSEYLWSLGEIDEETSVWTPTTLKDITFNIHAQGCKADIIIGDYFLAENESLLIDPDSDTFSIGAGGDDGYVQGYDNGGDYAAAHATGDYSYDAQTDSRVGQKLSGGDNYSLYRSFLKFVTSTIGGGSTITSAKLQLYGKVDNSVDDFIIRLQKWTGGTPITTADWNQFDGTNYDDGNFNTSGGWSLVAYNDIIITNYALIIKDGNTLICVRSSEEIAESPPTGYEYVTFYTHDNGSNLPQLYVEWEAAGGEEYDRAAAQSVMFVFNGERVFEISRAVTQAINFAFATSRLAELFRSVTQAIGFDFAVVPILEITRAVTLAINFAFETSGLGGLVRAVVLGIVFGFEVLGIEPSLSVGWAFAGISIIIFIGVPAFLIVLLIRRRR